MDSHPASLSPLAVLAIAPVSLLFVVMNIGIFTCSCGDVQPIALPGVLLGASMIYWTMLKAPPRPFAPGFLSLVCGILVSLLLLKAVLDVLLFNTHGPWLNIEPNVAAIVLASIALTLAALVLICRLPRAGDS